MKKILAVQTEIGKLSKDKKNPFFNSSYFDINQILEQLIPLLEKHELTVVQPISVVDGVNQLQTKVYDEDKLIVESAMTLPEITDPQKMGSAITYYRRYALQSLFLLQAEDDDANTASQAGKAPAKKKEYNPSPDKPASEKQIDFVKKLMEEKLGLSDPVQMIKSLDKKYGNIAAFTDLSQANASGFIEGAMNLPNKKAKTANLDELDEKEIDVDDLDF